MLILLYFSEYFKIKQDAIFCTYSGEMYIKQFSSPEQLYESYIAILIRFFRFFLWRN